MIIFLPARITPTGGSSSFARNFQTGLAKRGHQVIFEHQPNYDVLLVSASCPPRYLREAHRRAIPIVHRLDGVHYPTTVAGWRYPAYNWPIRQAYRQAQAIIYQSYYAKHCARLFLGTTRASIDTVIYNGVDLATFSPRGNQVHLRHTMDQQIFFTAQKFRRRDQIDLLTATVTLYREKFHADSKLVIAGDFVGACKAYADILRRLPYMLLLGPVSNDDLPQYARAADIFLYCHPNSTCPNTVIEALACGLPVAAVADGGVPELVTSGISGQLLPATGSGFYRRRTLSPEVFAKQLARIMRKPSMYAQAARAQAQQLFNIDDMLDAYLTVLTNVCEPKSGA